MTVWDMGGNGIFVEEPLGATQRMLVFWEIVNDQVPTGDDELVHVGSEAS